MASMRTGRFLKSAGLAVALAVALAGPPAFAQSGRAWTRGDQCYVRDIVMPTQDAAARMAADCETAARDPRRKQEEAAYATYNAARANNALAEIPQTPAAAKAASFAKARDLIARSLTLLPDESVDPGRGEAGRKAAQGFRFGRRFERARALIGSGLAALPAEAAQKADGCARDEACRTMLRDAVAELDVAAARIDQADPRADDLYFLRAKANIALSLQASARSDLERIVSRNRAAGLAQAKAMLINLYLAEGRAALERKTEPSAIAGATDLFRKAVEIDPASAEAAIGLGEAHLAAASVREEGRKDNFVAAEAAFRRAVTAAEARGLVKERADAHQGLGEALIGRSGFATPADEAKLRQDAIVAFNTSVSLEPNSAKRQMSLADAYARAKQWGDAEARYLAAVKMLGDAVDNRSDSFSAWMKIAEVRRAAGKPGGEVRTAYDEALKVAPQSPAAKVRLGESLFADGRLDDAERRFTQVISETEAAGRGAAEAAAAYYFRSLINLRRVSQGAQRAPALREAAVRDAENAVRTGGAELRFRRQACIAHILRGSASANSAEALGWCAGDETAEGQMLLGLFHLRSAQFLSGVNQSRARDTAEANFDRGLALLPANDAAVPVKPSFVSIASGESPPLRVLLEYGKAKVTSCFGRQVVLNLSTDQINAAARFFAAYSVDAC